LRELYKYRFFGVAHHQSTRISSHTLRAFQHFSFPAHFSPFFGEANFFFSKRFYKEANYYLLNRNKWNRISHTQKRLLRALTQLRSVTDHTSEKQNPRVSLFIFPFVKCFIPQQKKKPLRLVSPEGGATLSTPQFLNSNNTFTTMSHRIWHFHQEVTHRAAVETLKP